jgi:diguanylate cyclase (GGDEF)-like protein
MEPKPLVLLVDDSAFDRQWLQDRLMACGYAVEAITDGKSAVERVRRQDCAKPAIVLMDAVMPVMDGFAACQEIRSLPLEPAVPVLMVTGCEDAASIDRAFDSGAEDYIVKPVNIALLHRRIGRILKAQETDTLVRDLAYRDPLTGLPNRRMFQEELERRLLQATKAATTLAVAFLDLDKFKQVNDCWGHAAGDMVLQENARRFETVLGADAFISRLGGDEFMLIFSGSGTEACVAPLLRKLVQSCEAPVCCGQSCIEVGVSIGVSFFPSDGNEAMDLMRKADMAMYRAKAQRGSSYRCYSVREVASS